MLTKKILTWWVTGNVDLNLWHLSVHQIWRGKWWNLSALEILSFLTFRLNCAEKKNNWKRGLARKTAKSARSFFFTEPTVKMLTSFARRISIGERRMQTAWHISVKEPTSQKKQFLAIPIACKTLRGWGTCSLPKYWWDHTLKVSFRWRDHPWKETLRLMSVLIPAWIIWIRPKFTFCLIQISTTPPTWFNIKWEVRLFVNYWH